MDHVTVWGIAAAKSSLQTAGVWPEMINAVQMRFHSSSTMIQWFLPWYKHFEAADTFSRNNSTCQKRRKVKWWKLIVAKFYLYYYYWLCVCFSKVYKLSDLLLKALAVTQGGFPICLPHLEITLLLWGFSFQDQKTSRKTNPQELQPRDFTLCFYLLLVGNDGGVEGGGGLFYFPLFALRALSSAILSTIRKRKKVKAGKKEEKSPPSAQVFRHSHNPQKTALSHRHAHTNGFLSEKHTHTHTHSSLHARTGLHQMCDIPPNQHKSWSFVCVHLPYILNCI